MLVRRNREYECLTPRAQSGDRGNIQAIFAFRCHGDLTHFSSGPFGELGIEPRVSSIPVMRLSPEQHSSALALVNSVREGIPMDREGSCCPQCHALRSHQLDSVFTAQEVDHNLQVLRQVT